LEFVFQFGEFFQFYLAFKKGLRAPDYLRFSSCTFKKQAHILNNKHLAFSILYFTLHHLKTYFLRCDPISTSHFK